MEYLRAVQDTGIQLPAPLFVDLAEALVKMVDGDLEDGAELLQRTIAIARDSSRDWEWLYGRAIQWMMVARVATGEIPLDLGPCGAGDSVPSFARPPDRSIRTFLPYGTTPARQVSRW